MAEVRRLRADLLDGDQLDLVGLDGTLLGALERLLDRPLDRVVDLVAHGLLHTGGRGNGRSRLTVRGGALAEGVDLLGHRDEGERADGSAADPGDEGRRELGLGLADSKRVVLCLVCCGDGSGIYCFL